MKRAQYSVLVCVFLISYFDLTIAQDAQRRPEITIEIDGNLTNISIGGDGWGGVIANIQRLRQIPRDKDLSVVSALRSNMDALPPAYIYELVRRTCLTNPNEAAYLFNLAGARMRYDAYRCVDETAKAGVQATLVSLQMPECNASFNNELILAALNQLRDAKEIFSSGASPWWICSHGLAAIAAGLSNKTVDAAEWLKPEGEWPRIREKVQEDINSTLRKHSKR
jgi:hypothetical protein